MLKWARIYLIVKKLVQEASFLHQFRQKAKIDRENPVKGDIPNTLQKVSYLYLRDKFSEHQNKQNNAK